MKYDEFMKQFQTQARFGSLGDAHIRALLPDEFAPLFESGPEGRLKKTA